MASLASSMVGRALDAFVRRDPVLAREVLASDSAVDQLNVQLFRELLTYMSKGPNALRITFIDIAQMVIFMYEGRDVRPPAARAGEAGEA